MDFNQELINIIYIILTSCVGFVSTYATKYLKKKGFVSLLVHNKEIVNIVVHAVEQTYKTLHGNEKLNVAKVEVIKLLQEKKINISEKELDNLIHSAVAEMNKSIKDEMKK